MEENRDASTTSPPRAHLLAPPETAAATGPEPQESRFVVHRRRRRRYYLCLSFLFFISNTKKLFFLFLLFSLVRRFRDVPSPHHHQHHTYCLNSLSLSHSTRDTLSVFYAHAHTTFRLLSSDNDAAAAFYRPGGDGDAARRFFVYCRIGAAPPVAFSLPCPTLALFPPRSAHTFHPPPVL